MSTNQPTETPATFNLEAAKIAQQNFERLAGVSAQYVKGLAGIAAAQFELSRELMDGGVGDFNLLAQARTPEAFVEAELEVFRRRSERAAGAVKKISDQISGAWAEALEFAQPGVGEKSVAAAPTSKPAT